jgi:hypothetical protein
MKRIFYLTATLFFVLHPLCQLYSQTAYTAEQPDISYPVTDGEVNTFIKDSNTIYVGGRFAYIGQNTGHGVFIDSVTGHRYTNFPRVENKIMAAIPDGNGGVYIGGYFEHVGGLTRRSLAQIDSNGNVTPWNPDVVGAVNCMEMKNGIIYFGGIFSEVGGVGRNLLAAVDCITGNVTPFNPVAVPGYYAFVNSISISGNTLYAGGDFTTIGGVARQRIASFNLTTGLITSWNPGVYSGAVHKILSGNGKVYVCGSFSGLSNGVRKAVAELDSITGNLTSFNAAVNSGATIFNMILSNNILYVEGNFTTIYGLPRTRLAAIKLSSGYPNAWMPNPDATAHLLSLEGNNILVSGDFKSIGGAPKRHLALIDTISGSAQPFTDIKVNGTILTMCKPNGKMFLGGDYTSYGGEYRSNLAAFDRLTKEIKPWAPVATMTGGLGYVSQIKIFNEKIYICGYFDSVNTQGRNYVCAVDSTGALTAFNPNPNAIVNCMLFHNGNIYFGGGYTNFSGTNRNRLASVDEASWNIQAWNPNVSGNVRDFELVDSTLYIGGYFSYVGGVQREKLAAVGINTGSVKAWNPSVTGSKVHSLEYGNGQLYVGGEFTKIGGYTRPSVAAIDLFTGHPNSWAPFIDGSGSYVSTVKLYENVIYIHGSFNQIGAQQSGDIAALDAITGQPTSWLYNNSTTGPTSYSSSRYLCVIDSAVFIAGGNSTFYKNCVSGFHVLPCAKPFTHYVSGIVYNDSITDCNQQITETGLGSLIVNSMPDNSFVMSDNNGKYKLAINDSVAYTVQPVIPQRLEVLLDPPCPGSHTVTMTSVDPADSAGFDFGMDGHLCPVLRVNISSNRRRRCARSITSVTYINEGTVKVTNASVHVKFPSFVIPVNASSNFTWDLTDSSVVFNIDTLYPSQSGLITITDSVVCVAGITGLTQCTEAWITPINDCYNALSATLAGWDHSSLFLSGSCIPGTDTVRFIIKNNGSGNMADTNQYKIYSNYILQATGNYILNAGDSIVVNYYSGGTTLRMETEQMDGHPGNSHPSVWVEGCTTSGIATPGYVNGMPSDDDGLEVEMSCLIIRDSYDPNLKHVSPEGVGTNHIVSPATLLDYQINFQNTGNDTAYKVVVTDSLASYFDISTLEPGASSYPYLLSVSGTGGSPILKFTFDGINLTDSLSDEVHSHGFVNFKIAPKASVPIGTKIENAADIFFDFNPSVRTNTAWVTIDTLVLKPSHLAQVISQPIITPSHCLGDSISIATSFAGTSLDYQWYKNTALIAGATDSVLSFPNFTSADTGYYFCKASGLANTASTDTIYLYSITTPHILNNIVDISVCQSESANLYINASGGGISYQWHRNGNVLLPDTLNIISLTSVIPSDSGLYYCSVMNECGVDTSDTVYLTVHNMITPVIQISNDTLYTAGTYASYQWLIDGSIIPGANASQYIYNVTGQYTLKVTDSNGCEGFSNLIDINTDIREDILYENLVFPNPVSEYIVIKSNSGLVHRICIYSIQGQKVLDQTGDFSNKRIELTEFSDGLYFIDCYTKKDVKRFKFIKHNK